MDTHGAKHRNVARGTISTEGHTTPAVALERTGNPLLPLAGSMPDPFLNHASADFAYPP